MPALGFMLLLGGGIAVWAGYTGHSIGEVTKAILNGKTGTLNRIPLDPDLRPKVSTPSPTGGPGKTYTRPSKLPPGAVLNDTLDGYTWYDPKTGNTYTYDLNGNQTGRSLNV